jgi:hypothetical protein
MNPAFRTLQPFLSRLRNWEPTIRRSTLITGFRMGIVDEGIQVTAVYSGTEWKKVFTNQELLGHTFNLSSPAWKVPKRPCYWARQIISAILNQRGV